MNAEQVVPIDSAPGYFVSKSGNVFSNRRGTLQQLQPWVCKKKSIEYLVVGLGGKHFYVHRLVAITFLGPPPSPKHEVRHLDGCPKNNDVSNVAWGTHAENMADMIRHGNHGSRRYPERMARGERNGRYTKPERTARGERNGQHTRPECRPRGERNGRATINEDKVRDIRRVFAHTHSVIETAKQLGVTRNLASFVILRKTWRHVV